MKTLEKQFYDFVSKKPKDEVYNYYDTKICACAQFAESIGVDYNRVYFHVPERIAARTPHTFGALTKRMEKFFITCILD